MTPPASSESVAWDALLFCRLSAPRQEHDAHSLSPHIALGGAAHGIIIFVFKSNICIIYTDSGNGERRVQILSILCFPVDYARPTPAFEVSNLVPSIVCSKDHLKYLNFMCGITPLATWPVLVTIFLRSCRLLLVDAIHPYMHAPERDVGRNP